MSISSLKVQIKALAEKGKLTILHRFIEGVKLPNQYQLHIEGGQSDSGYTSQILAEGQADSGGGVSQILAEGQADSGYKPVNEPVTINQKDNLKESARKNPKISLPDYIDKATWDEWMTVRKKKGAVISETSTTRLLNTLALVEVDAELRMNGITPNEAIAIAIEQSWKGLNIEWLHNRLKQQGGSNATHQQYNKPAKLSAAEQVRKACGLGEYATTDGFSGNVYDSECNPF